MPDDVILAKIEIIERCLRRIDVVYAGDPKNLFEDWTKQDSILLNLERACQAAVDLAMRLIRLKCLGLPKETRESFAILQSAGILPEGLSASLLKMVGFSNIAVHNYRDLDLRIVDTILREKLDDFRQFTSLAAQLPMP